LRRMRARPKERFSSLTPAMVAAFTARPLSGKGPSLGNRSVVNSRTVLLPGRNGDFIAAYIRHCIYFGR
jgi:hypothetical protein